jgi:hypothetical protein
MNQTTVHVYPSSDALDRRIQEAMASLVPVTFVSCSDLTACAEGDAVLNVSGDREVIERLRGRKIRSFHAPTGTTMDNEAPADGRPIHFTRSRVLDERLRGRSLAHEPLRGYSGLRTAPGDEVLACCGENPVWIVREQEGLPIHLVSVPLPALLPGEVPFHRLHAARFFELLPLLHFLREVTASSSWKSPPLRACMMLDDPNLHWPSYGFLRYEKLAQQAKARRFHVALATVPLDAWIAHPGAVKLFRDHPEQLSLLVHGNDHSKHELSQSRSKENYLRLAAQSLRRMNRFERSTGLPVARIMAPPHGGFVSNCLAALLTAGFEGACASLGDLFERNSELFGGSTFGLAPAAVAPESVPVMSRFKLDPSCEGAIVLSAFLDRPIILVGHHHTAADGLELLAHTAEMVNSLGEVSWGSPEMMLRSNFRTCQENTTLWIEPYSCRIHLTVPQGITDLGLYSPRCSVPNADLEFELRVKRGSHLLGQQKMSDTPLKVMAGDRIELVSLSLGKVDYRKVENPESSLSLRAFPRRLLCEFRDRSMPLIPSDLIPDKWTSG